MIQLQLLEKATKTKTNRKNGGKKEGSNWAKLSLILKQININLRE